MQFPYLSETCRIIGYSLSSNNVNFVEIGFEYVVMTFQCGYVRSNANIPYKIHFTIGETFLVTLDTYAKKMNPPSIVFFFWGGGVHG